MIGKTLFLALEVAIVILILVGLYIFVFADFVDWAFSSVPGGVLDALMIFLAVILFSTMLALAGFGLGTGR